MKIVHAVANELGTANGGVPGDQTGREIRIADWYRKPWEMYIEPVDRNLGFRAAEIAKLIAAGNFGYDRVNRWTGYKSIISGGGNEAAIRSGKGDFDCSALVIACYILAGLEISASGYTGNLEKIFRAQGFKVYKDPQHLDTPQAAVAGGMYCTAGEHVCICVEDGQGVEPVGAPKQEPAEGEDGVRIRIKRGTVRIRKRPVDGKTLAFVRKGDVLKVIGQDPSGWYIVEGGYITNNSKYVEVL